MKSNNKIQNKTNEQTISFFSLINTPLNRGIAIVVSVLIGLSIIGKVFGEEDNCTNLAQNALEYDLCSALEDNGITVTP